MHRNQKAFNFRSKGMGYNSDDDDDDDDDEEDDDDENIDALLKRGKQKEIDYETRFAKQHLPIDQGTVFGLSRQSTCFFLSWIYIG
jgi:hypothetical protein